jgi:hypothetical protein
MDTAVVEGVLHAALRAPSAHNAQPWRLSRLADERFMLWYAYADKLQADPDDRDAMLALGGFFETLRLCAQAAGIDASIALEVRRRASGIELGVVSLGTRAGQPDPLAAAIDRRRCNRNKYDRQPLPDEVIAQLSELGNVFLDSTAVAPLVSRASVLSWTDPRFVSDLGEWTRFDNSAPDGMTLDCLRLNRWDVFWLRVALRLGRLPGWLAWIYAQRDVLLTRASSSMCVLTVENRSVEALFDCGRRLIRSWTLLNSLGYEWHPMSVVIDQATVAHLRTLIGGLDPVAIYRVGYTPAVAARSRRRALADVLVPAPQ